MSYNTDSSQQKILTFNTLCKNVISDKFSKKIYTCHTSYAKTYLLHNKITHFIMQNSTVQSSVYSILNILIKNQTVFNASTNKYTNL